MATVDVKIAFLKGISHKELGETTQEPEREVNFELSADAVTLLHQCKGFGDFGPSREVLHMTRPGTGCKDAPRCWSM